MAKTGSRSGVLVVEDDPAIRRLVRMVLEREGHRVDVAVDGMEAVRKLGTSEYDVIILDLMMPNLDGFSFMRRLVEDHPERLKKIIVTSAASPAVIYDGMPGTPFHVLSKPFDIVQLAEKVRVCIASQNGGTNP